jgi:hypothetical protein
LTRKANTSASAVFLGFWNVFWWKESGRCIFVTPAPVWRAARRLSVIGRDILPARRRDARARTETPSYLIDFHVVPDALLASRSGPKQPAPHAGDRASGLAFPQAPWSGESES